MCWPGPSRFQISTLAISCSCSNWYTSKYPNISPCWRVCLPTAWAALTSSTAFIFGVIPEDRSGGHSRVFLNKRQTLLCFLLGKGKQHSSSGRDPTLCCLDSGKCGRARKHEKTCTAVHSRHVLEMCVSTRKCANVDLTKADIDGNSLSACLYSIRNWSCAFVVSTVTNKKPAHVSLTKVKQFQGSSAFVKRSQWTLDQLRQVNGIDPHKVMSLPISSDHFSWVCAAWRWFWVHLSAAFLGLCSSLTGVLFQDCPEFDLVFENAFDQWSAGSAGEKCTFIQVLYHTCQRYCSARKPEFINCQSKLMGGKTVASPETSMWLHAFPDQNGVFLQSHQSGAEVCSAPDT